MSTATAPIRYHVTGMDCASCAAKIEGAARKVEGVGDVKVSIASQIMTLNVDDPARRLPVVDGTELVGIVSQADIARALPDAKVGDLVAAISEAPSNS